MSTNCIHCGANPRDGLDGLCTGCRRDKGRAFVLAEGEKSAKRMRESSVQQGLSDEQHGRCLIAANDIASMLACLAEHVGHPGPTKYDAGRLLLDLVNDILLTNFKVVAVVGEALVDEIAAELHREAAATVGQAMPTTTTTTTPADGGGH